MTSLKSFGVDFEAHVISAHRTPQRAEEFAKSAKENGVKVIIAAAGKAAHLGGVIAAYTTLPVIALPIKSSFMDGLDFTFINGSDANRYSCSDCRSEWCG